MGRHYTDNKDNNDKNNHDDDDNNSIQFVYFHSNKIHEFIRTKTISTIIIIGNNNNKKLFN